MFLIVRESLKHIKMERICPKFVFTCTHDTAIELRMLLLIDNNLREHKWWKNAQSDYFSVVFVFFCFCFFTFIWSETLANQSGLVSQGAWIKNPQSIYVFWLFIQKLLVFRFTLVSFFVLLGVGRRFLSATCDSIDPVVTSWQTSFNSIAEMSRKLLWRRVANPPF